jgi:outer membrane protein assembly factor BamB
MSVDSQSASTLRRHIFAVSQTSVSAYVLCACLVTAFGRDSLCAEFPQFRGVDGQGHADASGLPVDWNAKQNVVWSTPIPGNGWSSPVISNNRVWLTASQDRDHSLHVISVDGATGSILNDITVFRKTVLRKIHWKNTHASPTLIVDGDRLFAHFGVHGTACLSLSGKVLWTAQLSYYHHHGPAASPVLSGEVLILSCDGFPRSFYDRTVLPNVADHQFVVGLDCATGKIRWRQSRQGRHSYSTPLVIEVAGGRQVVCPGGDAVVAYEPSTGEELWRCRYTGYSVVPRPVFGHGLVYVCTGYDDARLAAIRPDGRGDITNTHVEWTADEGIPFNPSPLLVGDELYIVSDLGIAQCLDAKTGKRHWRGRLGGKYSASPIFADGKIFFQSESGVTHILEPGLEFNRVATNRLRGRTLASPAIVDRSIYIRTDSRLYRIEEGAATP